MTELNCPLRFTKPVHHHNAYKPFFYLLKLTGKNINIKKIV